MRRPHVSVPLDRLGRRKLADGRRDPGRRAHAPPAAGARPRRARGDRARAVERPPRPPAGARVPSRGLEGLPPGSRLRLSRPAGRRRRRRSDGVVIGSLVAGFSHLARHAGHALGRALRRLRPRAATSHCVSDLAAGGGGPRRRSLRRLDDADARSADLSRHARAPGRRGRRRRGRGPARGARGAGRRARHRLRPRAQRRIPRREGRAEFPLVAARPGARGLRARQPLLHRDRGRGADRAGARDGAGRRRARQRRRPAGALRLHHALDRRPQPAGHRRLDRRRLADPRPHAEGAARIADPGRLRPARGSDERLSRPARGGRPVADPAAPVLGDGARRPDRGSSPRRQRGGREDAPRSRDRALGGRSGASPVAARSIWSAPGPATRTSSPSAPSA